MAWIDETSNAVQLNGFFGKIFFLNLFSQSATLPVYLFVFYLSIYNFYLTNFQRWIFFKVLAWTVREL